MTVYYQSFDGGTGVVNWDTTAPIGSPVSEYYAGSSTAVFTESGAIRGRSSVKATTAAGATSALIAFGVSPAATTARAHVYFRVPDKIAADGQFILGMAAEQQVQVVIRGNGAVSLESWNTLIGQASPAGTLPAAGTVCRAALTVSGGTVSAALYAGHGTTPLWTTSASTTAVNVTDVQTGIPWTHSQAESLSIVVDDFRVDTEGVGFLPPEVQSKPPSWVREPIGWRRLGDAHAVPERYVPAAGSGAARLGSSTMQPPTGALHVAVNGSDSGGNGSAASPYATYGKALSVVQDGGTIVLHSGSHHVGIHLTASGGNADSSLWPVWAGVTTERTGVTVMAAPGEVAWLDGSVPVTGWTADGAAWAASVKVSIDRSPTGALGKPDNTEVNWNYLVPEHPLAAWPEQVWVDGRRLKQVAKRGEVTVGTFWVEGSYGTGDGSKTFTSSRYIIGENPSGKTVRVATATTCLSSTGTGFALRGVGFRRFAASTPFRGVVKLRHSDCVMEDVVFEDAGILSVTGYQAHRSTFRRVSIYRAGMLGLEATESDDLYVEDLLVSEANYAGFNHAPESAGVKFTHMRRPLFMRPVVIDCYSHGMWFDESVTYPTVVSPDVEFCDGEGIVAELSHAATIIDAHVSESGGSAVTFHNCSGANRVWSSTLTRPNRLSSGGRVLKIVSDDRAPLKAGSVGLDPRFGFPHPDGCDALTTSVVVRNCVLGPSTGMASFVFNQDFSQNSGAARDWKAHGIDIDKSLYVARKNGPDWKWVLANSGSADPSILWSIGDMQTRGIDKESQILPHEWEYGSDVHGALTSRAVNSKPTGAPMPKELSDRCGRPAGDTYVGAIRPVLGTANAATYPDAAYPGDSTYPA